MKIWRGQPIAQIASNRKLSSNPPPHQTARPLDLFYILKCRLAEDLISTFPMLALAPSLHK